MAVSEHCLPQLERRGVGTTVTVTSQVRKLRHGEVKRRVRSHASGVVEPRSLLESPRQPDCPAGVAESPEITTELAPSRFVSYRRTLGS